jgi:hypothetical protein
MRIFSSAKMRDAYHVPSYAGACQFPCVSFARRRRDLAVKTQADGCRRCGDVLHKNRYQRKPRGGGLINLGEGPHFCLLDVGRLRPETWRGFMLGPGRQERTYAVS